MVGRLPEEMKTLMSLCAREVVILAHHAGSTGWSVDFQIDESSFRLEYDRGFLVVVKDPAGEARTLAPEKGTWFSDSLQGLAEQIDRESAKSATESNGGCGPAV